MSLRAFAYLHNTLVAFVYTLCMSIVFLFLILTLSFQSLRDPLLARVMPHVIRAQYADATAAATVSSPFVYTFNSSGTLYEAGSMGESSSPYFWLNSGGKLLIQNSVGKTVQGSLVSYDPWRLMYSSMNPLDTENGYKPQNTLRLVTRNSWSDVQETLQFNIRKTNLTDTPNRGPHSGIFFMGRYSNSDNLYYVGVRHDGLAVIKKKINGTYYTLAYTQIFGVAGEYNRDTNPNLIPQNTWMALRTRITNQADGSVKVQLLLDRENDGSFVSILSATDAGTGGSPLKNAGYLGVRTDFMDVEFDNFRAEKI